MGIISYDLSLVCHVLSYDHDVIVSKPWQMHFSISTHPDYAFSFPVLPRLSMHHFITFVLELCHFEISGYRISASPGLGQRVLKLVQPIENLDDLKLHVMRI